MKCEILKVICKKPVTLLKSVEILTQRPLFSNLLSAVSPTHFHWNRKVDLPRELRNMDSSPNI